LEAQTKVKQLKADILKVETDVLGLEAALIEEKIDAKVHGV
jgi:hypothetical protein